MNTKQIVVVLQNVGSAIPNVEVSGPFETKEEAMSVATDKAKALVDEFNKDCEATATTEILGHAVEVWDSDSWCASFLVMPLSK